MSLTGPLAQVVFANIGGRYCALTAAAEDSNTIAVTVAVKDGGGITQAEAVQCIARVVGEPAADYTIAETGGGTENSVTAHTGLVFTTSTAGAATVTVTDVGGASGETVYLEVYCVGRPSLSTVVACTFD